MKHSFVALCLVLFVSAGAGATPIPDHKVGTLLVRVAAESAPQPILHEHDGGRRYEALEKWPHDKPPSADQLNEKSAQFHQHVQEAHEATGPSRQPGPNVVAAHFHAKQPDMPGPPGHIAYSSTMSVENPYKGIPQPEAFVETSEAAKQKILEKPKKDLGTSEKKLQGQLRAGKTSIAHRTQPASTVAADPHENFAKCAEAGTCALIEQQYGKDTNMNGDKVSAYGLHGTTGQPGRVVGHVAACSSANHKQFDCNGVAETKGLDDVNRPGRPDSSVGNSPKPQSPVRTPKRPLSPAPSDGNGRPPSPQTPGKHYEQSTASSRAKQKGKTVKRSSN